MPLLTTSQVIYRLVKRARRLGSYKALAEEIGVSPQYLSDVVRRRKEISSQLAKKLGFEKKIRYYESLQEQSK